MSESSKHRKLKVLFDEKQFRGSHPGEQTYAKLLIEQFMAGDEVEPYILAGESWSEPLSPRCAALLSRVPSVACTFASDREFFRQRPKLWQKVLNRAYRYSARGCDALSGQARISKALTPRPDIIHLSRFHLFKAPERNRPLVLATVHDVIPLVRPEFFPPDIPGYTKKLINHYVRHCDHIIAVSETTRRDLLKLFGLPPEKISVSYSGILPAYANAIQGEEEQSPLPADMPFSHYFLWVGTIEPRKNFSLVYEALKKVRRDGGNVGLVVVGSQGWMCEKELRQLDELAALGIAFWSRNVTDSTLRTYYYNALGLVMPSFYEGFGSPVVEAMACGCPVITSKGTSMDELCGDSALLIDPQDVRSLEQAMLALAGSESLQREMSRKGLTTAERFTAAKCAENTIAIYKAELERKGSVR